MTYKALWRRLAKVYGDGEAQALARLIYEVRYGLTFSDILMGRDSDVPNDELEQIALRLEQQEPIQYILGHADFCGRSFLVNEHVLIPRPETAELCQWILAADKHGLISNSEQKKVRESPLSPMPKILDVGTGSGCIAITLAAMYPEAQVIGWDISEDALEVAKINAIRNNVNVSFEQVDVLNLPSPLPFGGGRGEALSLIVSNPPYICNKERATMEANVLEHEPHTALFVPDDDPLLFYRAIAQFGQTALKQGGWLYFEINPLYAEPLCDMLCDMRFCCIETKTDQYGKQRMTRARKALR